MKLQIAFIKLKLNFNHLAAQSQLQCYAFNIEDWIKEKSRYSTYFSCWEHMKIERKFSFDTFQQILGRAARRPHTACCGSKQRGGRARLRWRCSTGAWSRWTGYHETSLPVLWYRATWVSKRKVLES